VVTWASTLAVLPENHVDVTWALSPVPLLESHVELEDLVDMDRDVDAVADAVVVESTRGGTLAIAMIIVAEVVVVAVMAFIEAVVVF
jgi:hypothetical protein